MKFSLYVCVINLYRLSYAVYTLHALCRENANSHLVLLYDIVCALHKHLKVHVLLTRVLRIILLSYFYMFIIIIIGPWTNKPWRSYFSDTNISCLWPFSWMSGSYTILCHQLILEAGNILGARWCISGSGKGLHGFFKKIFRRGGRSIETGTLDLTNVWGPQHTLSLVGLYHGCGLLEYVNVFAAYKVWRG